MDLITEKKRLLEWEINLCRIETYENWVKELKKEISVLVKDTECYIEVMKIHDPKSQLLFMKSRMELEKCQ